MLAIVLTFSRAGIVAALAALGILGGLAAARHERQRLVPVGLAALVLPLALGWASISDPGLEYRLLAGVDESSSVQPPRPEFWAGAVAMLRDHPLFGVGLANFRW